MKKYSSVMIIDDEDVSLFIANKILQYANVTDNVIEIGSGEDAIKELKRLDRLDQLPPELILIDINMPIMDGYEFVRHFRDLDLKNKETIELAFLTTTSTEKEKLKMNKLGVEKIFHKPLTVESITKS